MNLRSFIHLGVAVLFIYFSFVQLNDTDGWMWLLIYASISLLALLRFLGIRLPYLTGFVAAILLILLISNINLFFSWTNAGRPAFIDYEATDIQAVENIREFLGLSMAFLAAATYWILDIKKEEKT